MTAIGRVACVSLDTTEPATLAAFYVHLLDYQIVFEGDDFIALKGTSGVPISAQRVEGYVAPSWPDDEIPKQMHLEIAVTNLDDAESVALSLGATKPSTQPSPDSWRVLLDPAGHPFCITTLIPPDF